MVYQYVVTLKNTSRKYIDNFSLLSLGISMLFFVRELIYGGNAKAANVFGSCCIFIIIAIIGYNLYQSRRKGKTVYRYALFIAGMLWFLVPSLQWLCLPFTIMGFIEGTAKLPLDVGFLDDRVVINTFIKRRYSWADFNNVILKDDLLTLDFKNNRLLQRETIDEEGDAEEDEFNAYCQEQLRAVSRVLRV